ncbi:lamin tail domain-containing protein [soil metagenome]
MLPPGKSPRLLAGAPLVKRALICALAVYSIAAATANLVVINEIHYDHEPKTQRGEFVELYNPTDAPADVSGWRLVDAVSYVIPAGTTIAPGGFLVIGEDPAVMQLHFGVAALGPYSGKLSNDGEDLRLEDASGSTVDRVDYGIGFPWPTASRGAGASMELINPGLDNDLGSSWRSAQSGFTGPSATYITPGEQWRYRKGTSEASTPSDAWRQAGFAEDSTWLDGATSIGYGDDDDATILSDMQGNYASIFLRKTFSVTSPVPSELLLRVYHDDGAIVWINGTEVGRLNVALGEITFQGVRASDPPPPTTPIGAAVTNHEASWTDIPVSGASSFLTAGTNTIAIHAFNDSLGDSDLSIDCELRTPDPAEPTPGQPTPGATNSVFSHDAPPNIRQVNHSPQQPKPGEDVLVTAKVTDPEGVASVTLSYQLVPPGAYIRLTDPEYETTWTDIPMLDDGTGGDGAEGDSIYTVTLPGTLNSHRHLVRYRITVEDTPGNAVQTPFADDESPNFAYFCYDGIPDWTGSKRPGVAPVTTYPAAALDSVPVYHLITRESDVILCQYTGPTDGVYRYLGTFVYDGEVYDHMRYRIRGQASTRQVGKNKWKFNFNRARPFKARDNYGELYDVSWDKINGLPGTNPWWRDNLSTDGTLFCESLGFRFYQLVGGTSSNTQFYHFRIIDGAAEASPSSQYEGDFWGLYIAIEQPDSRFLDERDLPSGNLYNVHGGASSSSLRNQGPTQVTDRSDLTAFQNRHNRFTTQSWWEQNLDFDAYFAWNIGNLAINNSDARPQENVNYYHNPDTGKWYTLPWDIDLTFEDAPHLGRGDTPAWENIHHCLQYPAINQAYQNRVREVLDLLMDNDQAAHLTDEFAGLITRGGADNLVEANQAQWDYHPRKNKPGIWYANFNPSLLPARDFASLTQYTKDFLTVGGYGRELLATKQVDPAVPATPTITYSGPDGFPADGLTFSSSPFSDPQGPGTFAAMEWRIGQIHNPSTPGYLAGDRFIYEIESFASSGRLPAFQSEFAFSATDARVGNTYRARVRHFDSSGKASHWSDSVEFTVSLPDVSLLQDSLMITEIMYHPVDATPDELAAGFESSDFEFLELANVGDSTLDLTDVRFTKGIDFDFVAGTITSLVPGARVLVVRNKPAFESRYGTGLPVAGDYLSSKLDNGGENLKLSFGAGTAIHEFEYDDAPPWPTSADGDGFSLVMIAPSTRPDHGDPFTWRPSTSIGGNPGTTDSQTFLGDPAADQDHDGIFALMEHALGGSDSLPDPGLLPAASLQPHAVGGIPGEFLTFAFRRNLAADDIVYTVETSADLLSWLPNGVFVSSTNNGDGTTTETYRSPNPHGVVPGEFIHLKVTQRP